MRRKEILLNTHADICRMINTITQRAIGLRENDVTAFKSLQKTLLNAQKMVQVMLEKREDNYDIFRSKNTTKNPASKTSKANSKKGATNS